ncbi:hypothetical protein [Pseudoxanthomonas sp. 10H]|uniref:hypothetical protein n=1 Tax=Pseudoxanthomonas sp. 10H TaxID=3242729 RepID=UPI0035569A05
MTGRGGWRALALAVSLVPAAAATAAPAQPAEPAFLGEVISETRVLYPLLVGGWLAESEQRYAEQRLGVSVRYADNRKQRWIDLYFYPAGVQTAQALALFAGSERDSIAEAARQSGRGVEMGVLEPFTLAAAAPAAGDAREVGAWRLGLQYPDDALASAMLLFPHGLYLVKARASAAQPPATVGSLQRELEAFMASVAGQLRIVNTGTCWLPARVDLAATLPPVDAGEVLASYREPGREPSAVVVGDRVLVAQAEAARAPLLAEQLAGSLYPGCVAPEAIEPDVPPALREIRIEYRRPVDADAPSRGPRIGRPRSPVSGTG